MKICKIGHNTTIRLPLKAGDYLLWVATDSPFTSDSESGWTIRDFWQLRNGDLVTITNKWADVPEWFDLHPLEVAGEAVSEMQKKLNQGFKPVETMDGPNIWRIKAGDRVVWIRVPTNEVVVSTFSNCALALGESSNQGEDVVLIFGAPEGDEPPPSVTSAMRKGFQAAVSLGTPQTISEEWLFGA